MQIAEKCLREYHGERRSVSLSSQVGGDHLVDFLIPIVSTRHVLKHKLRRTYVIHMQNAGKWTPKIRLTGLPMKGQFEVQVPAITSEYLHGQESLLTRCLPRPLWFERRFITVYDLADKQISPVIFLRIFPISTFSHSTFLRIQDRKRPENRKSKVIARVYVRGCIQLNQLKVL